MPYIPKIISEARDSKLTSVQMGNFRSRIRSRIRPRSRSGLDKEDEEEYDEHGT